MGLIDFGDLLELVQWVELLEDRGFGFGVRGDLLLLRLRWGCLVGCGVDSG